MRNTDTDNAPGNTASNTRKSTAQLLVSTGFSCLKRHRLTGEYYGVKKSRGKIFQKKLRTDSGDAVSERKLAEKFVRAWVDGLDSKAKAEPRNVSEHLAKFCKANGVPTLAEVADYEKRNERKKGKDREESIIPRSKKNILWALRKIDRSWKLDFKAPISSVKTSDVQAFLSAQKPELKASSFNELSRQLKNVFQLAVADGLISSSPYEGIDKKQRRRSVKKEGKGGPKQKIPSVEEFEAIVSTIRAQRFADTKDDSADLAAFLGLAALGEAEAWNLKWDDVDFKKKELRIERQKTGVFFTVPFYDYLEPFLIALYRKHGKPAGGEGVFKVASCKKGLATACRTLNLPPFSPRSLRKMGIVRLIRAGVNIKLIAKWQGHQDGGKLILDTYSDVISASDSEFEQAELSKLKPKATEKLEAVIA